MGIQDDTINVAAPEFVVLLGAAVGGLFAYVLLWSIGKAQLLKQVSPPWIGWLVGALVSGLLSLLVAILLSRVSQSDLPIRVTVSDVWGGFVIGFLANYGGLPLLDKLAGMG